MAVFPAGNHDSIMYFPLELFTLFPAFGDSFSYNFYNDFYFFHYSWFVVFCHFSTVQQGDSVTHVCIHSFFLTLPFSIISDYI